MDEAVVVGMEEVDWRICPRNRSVVGMEKENSEIYPRSRNGRGHGRVSISNMHIQTSR